MFTGAMSIEHFARDHPLHYKRLVDTGELLKYLVDEPSKPMNLASKILGFTLMATTLWLFDVLAAQIGADRATHNSSS